MVYDLPLEEVKVKSHQVTTLHLMCALAFTGTGAIIFVYNYIITMWGAALLAAGLVLLFLTFFKNKWLTQRNRNTVARIIELAIALFVGLYSVMQQWKFPTVIFGILSAALLFGLYWERTAGGALFVNIDETGLRLPITSRQRFLKWTEIEQVVMRFGTISINCLDNRLFQWNIGNSNIDPQQFEAYCEAQVEANKNKRIVDEW
jgi:hypothetical protein